MASKFLARNEWDWCAYRIGAHFASYLINGDASGLEDSEARALDAFCTDAQMDRAGGHWTVDEKYGEEFAHCEVSHLFSQCVNVRYMFKVGT